MTNTSKQYSLALFSLALERKQADEIYQEFHRFVDGMDALSWKFFLNPKISDIDKKDLIEKIIKNQLLVNFFKTVVDNKRFNFIKEIVLDYKRLLNDHHSVAEISVYSKQALSKVYKDRLVKKFTAKLNKKIMINEIINPDIVGGMRIEYQGKVLDQTVNANLDKLIASLIG
ncbi:ATP synthase F1 subunit delta [Mycoplasmatota bacterium]|nr:ATP synthase F1 subunit delta [Mycoplasmatota bacterium]